MKEAFESSAAVKQEVPAGATFLIFTLQAASAETLSLAQQ